MFKMILVSILLLFLFQKSCGFNTIPSYIKACSKSDPKFNECAIKNGQAAISFIVQGDEEYHIPSFMPFKLAYATLDGSQMVKLSVTNISLTGFQRVIIKNLDWNFDKKLIKLHITAPDINVKGTYNLNGRILVMSFNGHGLMNNTFYGNDIQGQSTYVIEKHNNKEYGQLDEISIKYKPDKVIVQFDNLLNNAEISKNINKFLNDNWRILEGELNSSIENILCSIAKSIINPIIAKIPFDNIVLP